MKAGKEKIRLDKFLTSALEVSRSQAREKIKKGLVHVEDRLIKDPAYKVMPKENVYLDGQRLSCQAACYLMLNKPAGVISATEDTEHKTVLDLVTMPKKGLFPVGRLDKDTEGLLLLTDDGALAHRLLSPRKHVDKKYLAILDGPVGEREEKLFLAGLDIGDKKKTLPAILERTGEGNRVYITLREGRFHQVKRMAHAVGREVLYLKRISMGPLSLDETLKPGEYRALTEEEIRALLEDRKV